MCMVLYSEVFLTLSLEDDTPKCQQHSSAVTLQVWTEKTPDVSQNYCHRDKDTFPACSLLTLKSTRWSWSEMTWVIPTHQMQKQISEDIRMQLSSIKPDVKEIFKNVKKKKKKAAQLLGQEKNSKVEQKPDGTGDRTGSGKAAGQRPPPGWTGWGCRLGRTQVSCLEEEQRQKHSEVKRVIISGKHPAFGVSEVNEQESGDQWQRWHPCPEGSRAREGVRGPGQVPLRDKFQDRDTKTSQG